MHNISKRFVAALTGLATLVAPATALAEGEYCPTYVQVESNATGGQFVGGLLVGEADREVTTTRTTTKFMNGSVSGGGNNANASVSGSYQIETIDVTVENQHVGYYKMNDGSSWEVNCTTGDSRQR